MKQKKCYRMMPCDAFDVGRIESWLTDMAAEGWHLKSRGWFFVFERGEPKPVRYRLSPKRDFGDANQQPEKAEREMYEACGWEAVTDVGQFFIFRTEDETAREIHTEPQVYAHAVKRLLRHHSLNCLLEALLVADMAARLMREPMRWLITFGSVATVMRVVTLAVILGIMAAQIVRLIGLHRGLKRGAPVDHSKPWRKGALWHRLGTVGMVTVYVLFLAMMLTRCTGALTGSQMDIADFPGDAPFVTIQDLYPEGEYDEDATFAGYDQYNTYSSDCAPMSIEWREYGKAVMPDGTAAEGALIVHYHQTHAPWIARALAEEYLRVGLREKHSRQVDAPQVDADYAVAYSLSGIPTVILQKGNVVVMAKLTVQDPGGGYPVERWAEMMISMMQE